MARNPSFCHFTFSAKYSAHDSFSTLAAHLHPQLPQVPAPAVRALHSLQVLRRKDIVPERAKLLDKLNVRRKPLHVKQFVLGKPTKL